jgi:hypothetical protein
MLKHLKSYFSLHEVQTRWEASPADMKYYILEGLLEIRVWTFGLEAVELSGSQPVVLNGLQMVYGEDLWAVLRTGASPIGRFNVDGLELRRTELTPSFIVREDDLFVTRPERDRFERLCGFVPEQEYVSEPVPYDPLQTFRHDPTYAHVGISSANFRLGHIQASIVKQLHVAAEAGRPWVHQDELLTHARSRSARVVDLFGDRAKLAALIERDGNGYCRLNLPLQPSTSLKRSAYTLGRAFTGEFIRRGSASHPSLSASP